MIILAILGLTIMPFVAGFCFNRAGYWRGRLDEFDYCKQRGWLKQ